jgi:hypothetical protein
MSAELEKPSWWEKAEAEMDPAEHAEMTAWDSVLVERQEAERRCTVLALRFLADTLSHFRYEILAVAQAFDDDVPHHLYRALWEDQAGVMQDEAYEWWDTQELELYHAWKAQEAARKNSPE